MSTRPGSLTPGRTAAAAGSAGPNSNFTKHALLPWLGKQFTKRRVDYGMPKPLKIAVFDINGTLYRKKSKEEFFRFICFRNSYKLVDIYYLLLFKLLGSLRLVNQTQFKENFFNYLNRLPPEQVKQYAAEYWSIEYPRYFNEKLLKRVDELRQEGVKIFCISGGLDVYMDPLYELFPVDAHLSTRVRYKNDTYKIVGEACKDEVKIRRLEEHLDGQPYEIVEAYSDDEEAILEKAKQAYVVKKDGEVTPL